MEPVAVSLVGAVSDLMKHLADTPEMRRLWPCRLEGGYWLVDTMTQGSLKLSTNTYFRPLGLRHSSGSVAVLQELCQETIGRSWDAGITPCCRAAIAVLWLALAPERFPLLADTFSRAAGTAGKQKWSLILPSSASWAHLCHNHWNKISGAG